MGAEKRKPFDTLDFIMKWEGGECSPDQEVKGFQALIDSGVVWQLQGCYGRTAQALIDAGECHEPRRGKR